MFITGARELFFYGRFEESIAMFIQGPDPPTAGVCADHFAQPRREGGPESICLGLVLLRVRLAGHLELGPPRLRRSPTWMP